MVGRDKTGDDRFYKRFALLADKRHDDHLHELMGRRADRMSGRHLFTELTKDFTPQRRVRVDARKAELRTTMPLHELRQARAMTQKPVGEVLKVNQPAVAKLKQRSDMYVSNLRAYIEAMGGRLNIVAEFPQGSVLITNFSDAGQEARTC